MWFTLARRFLTEPDPRLLARFAHRVLWNGAGSMRRFRRAARRGERTAPPFLFISLTNDCNLHCQGCWVTPTDPPAHLPAATLDRIVEEAVAGGARFFGLLGGEPLCYPGLLDFLARHRDVYFQLFTNGTLLDDATAAAFRRLGNVTPLISIEGGPESGDLRRGGTGVYGRAVEALAHCRRHRLITGVACSICRSNLDELATEAFCREMAGRGAHYLWYYIYRPVGPRPTPELALSDEQITDLRRFLVEVRTRAPLLVIDAYWDAEGRALCPAAVGLSHHVSPFGDLEPCPVIQFAAERAGNGAALPDLCRDSAFLADCRRVMDESGRGCILLRRPDRLLAFIEASGARDTSGRGTALEELRRMAPRPDHDQPGRELPERSRLYRAAKRAAFFGLGAYG